MERKVILICATGRSGSTTMQRILNTCPKVNICGENNSAIQKLLEFYQSLKCPYIDNRPYSHFLSNNQKPCWYNSFDREEIKTKLRDLIISFMDKNGCDIIGFKEIRYEDKHKIEMINVFKELFPNTKVVVHIREDVTAQSQSMWWKTTRNSRNLLLANNGLLVDFQKKNSNYVYLSTFNNMFDIEKLKKMFEFLEISDRFNETEIKNVLTNNQG